MKQLVFFYFLLVLFPLQGQYSFKGQITNQEENKTVYLSIIEDYRKLSRVYLDQIIKKTTTDSLGNFQFSGNNLSDKNGMYRIHIDDCSETENNNLHFLGQCNNTESILFITNNKDNIIFPPTHNNEILCEINSTNSSSNLFLQIETLKEEMIYDFTDHSSTASRKLNSEKWFSRLQEFGIKIKEPLAELYIYDFLSDKRNETYSHYLKDLGNTSYYDELLHRLKTAYPNTVFTQLYETEITTDKQLLTLREPKSEFLNYKWILAALLIFSLGGNVYLWRNQKKSLAKEKNSMLHKLTQQEQKIVASILANKSNKEIAEELFISLSTVKTHINNIYKKLNTSSREEIKSLFS